MTEPAIDMKCMLKVLAIILWLSVIVLLVAVTELAIGDMFYLFLFNNLGLFSYYLRSLFLLLSLGYTCDFFLNKARIENLQIGVKKKF
jgi:hypothetical protein